MSSQSVLFNRAQIYTPNRVVTNGSLLVRDGKIAAVYEEASAQADGVDVVVDVQGRHLIPGFVDVHVHGGGGFDAMAAGDNPDALQGMSRYYASTGTTSLLATTTTAGREHLERAIKGIVDGMEQGTLGTNIVGIHLEGPFINEKRRGAQSPDFIRPGTIEELDAYLNLAKGTLRLITLAPETEGALDVVRFAADSGVTVSVGHTDADFATVQEAVRCGASHVTHFFNGMNQLHHREPGVVGAGLLLDELTVELICDGIHVDRNIVQLVFKTKSIDHIVLITDAVLVAGCPDGEYASSAGRTVVLQGGKITLKHKPDTLAGSCLTMDRALRNAIEFTGLTLLEILPALTCNPARQIGLADRIGSIEAGKDADLVILDENLHVVSTFVGGRRVYSV